MSNIYNQLIQCVNEKDVENVFRSHLKEHFKGVPLTSPFNTDGILYDGNIFILCEFKYKYNFLSRVDITKVVCQCIYYIKTLVDNGKGIPKVIFIGDDDEVLFIESKYIYKYLSHNYNWKIPASKAFEMNEELKMAVLNDTEINPYVQRIDENYRFEDTCNMLEDLCNNNHTMIKINEMNIDSCYSTFSNRVLTKNKLDVNATAALFLNILLNRDNYYIHPRKKNTLITSTGEMQINGEQYIAFFNHFSDVYTPREKEALIRIFDRLKEDEKRRNEGAFFTPTIWCHEMERETKRIFGDDIFERALVWDCAAGTGNLTRDIKCNNLWISSLLKDEIDLQIENGVNDSAKDRFVYDFLNQSVEELPQDLINQLDEGVEVLFYINPPYGAAGAIGNKNNDVTTKVGISFTDVGDEMKSKDLGKASTQLYAQFLYKICALQNIFVNSKFNIVTKSTAQFLTGEAGRKFRSYLFNEFELCHNYMFNAGHFSGCSSQWGVLTSFWKTGKTINDDKVMLIKDVDDDGSVIDIDSICLYNLDNGYTGSKWVREEIKQRKEKATDYPQMSSGLIIKPHGKGTMFNDGLGYMLNDSNNVMRNKELVLLLSSPFSQSKGFSIIPENFLKCTALFTARKSIVSNWINDKCEYIAPNESHPDWVQYKSDSMIYSLFHASSNQSSMRDVDYKDKIWDIKNHFFYMSRDEIIELANANHFDECYSDAKKENVERYCYNLTNELTFSPDVQLLLELGRDLIRKSFVYRKIAHDQYPEFHLNAWDCGYYQINKMCKTLKVCTSELKALRDQYKIVELRLRELTYELGFLKR